MNRILPVLLVMLPTFSMAEDIEIKGEMICELKDATAIEVYDGYTNVSEDFFEIVGGVKVGDTATFVYESVYDSGIDAFRVKLAMGEIWSADFVSLGNYQHQDPQTSANLRRLYGEYVGFNDVNMGSDAIVHGTGLMLARYFKDDWAGLVRRGFLAPGGRIFDITYTVNCRHTLDRLDDLIETVRIKRETRND